MQCCGSETFISDPVSDPDPAFSEFRIRIRFRILIRIRIRIRIQILDLNPDQKQAKTFFFELKNKLKKYRRYGIFVRIRPSFMKFGNILGRRLS